MESAIETISGHNYNCHTDGDRSKPLMLFLHGFPDIAESWKSQMDYFKNNYFVVAYDQRGYNTSVKFKKKSEYRIDRLADDVKQVIEYYGYNKAIVVSHDWGGIVAYHFSETYSEMVDRLVVTNAPHFLAWKSKMTKSLFQGFKSWYVFFFQIPWIPDFVARYGGLRFLMWFSSNKGSFSNLSQHKKAWKQPGAINGMLGWYRNVFRYKSVEKITKTKTLLIWGKKDVALGTSMVEANMKYFPNTTVRYLDDASHWAVHEYPDKVNGFIEEFLDK